MSKSKYKIPFIYAVLFTSLIVISLAVFLMSAKKKIYTIGISTWGDSEAYMEEINGFKQGLRANGFIEGDNVSFIINNPKTDPDKQAKIISSFVSKKVDLIHTVTTPGTAIAKEVTDKIPIIFSIVTYPVEAGLIESLQSSNNNLVGVRNFIPIHRHYFAFTKLFGEFKRIGVVHRKDEANSQIQFNDLAILLSGTETSLVNLAATDLEDLKIILNKNIGNIDAIFLACDTLNQNGGEHIVINYCLKHKIPSFSCNPLGVEDGSLMGNVIDFYSLGKMAGIKASLVLKGANPAWITTESINSDNIIVNKNTADKINIIIPDNKLHLIDRTIYTP